MTDTRTPATDTAALLANGWQRVELPDMGAGRKREVIWFDKFGASWVGDANDPSPTVDLVNGDLVEALAAALRESERQLVDAQAALAKVQKHATMVRDMLDIGDQRLLASDGPVGGQLPDLSPDEWGKVYRAAKAIAALPPRPAPKEATNV